MEGFIIGDGEYAAIPFGKQLMIIYQGHQLKVCKTEQSARKYIKDHIKLINSQKTDYLSAYYEN